MPRPASRLYLVLERPLDGYADDPATGFALARVVEAHPVLEHLLDFSSVDPLQIAQQVGMVYPYEEDGLDDLDDIDFGPADWFEAAPGLAAVEAAQRAVRENPQSLAEAIYDPTLTPAAVLADLESLAATLRLAQQHETRFHFVMMP